MKLTKYACVHPERPRKYVTPPAAEAAPHAQTSRRLQETAKDLYRSGRDDLREVEEQMRMFWHTGTGKTSILRWHKERVEAEYPKAEEQEEPGNLASFLRQITAFFIRADGDLLFGQA